MVCDPDTDRQGTGTDGMHRTHFERKWVPGLFCDRAGMRLAQCRGVPGVPETTLSILCHRGHRYAGRILSGVKESSEAFQTPADRL